MNAAIAGSGKKTLRRQAHTSRVIYALILALFLPFAWSCGRTPNIEGKEAPDFTAERLDGGVISLSEFKGKPVILYWFSSW